MASEQGKNNVTLNRANQRNGRFSRGTLRPANVSRGAILFLSSDFNPFRFPLFLVSFLPLHLSTVFPLIILTRGVLCVNVLVSVRSLTRFRTGISFVSPVDFQGATWKFEVRTAIRLLLTFVQFEREIASKVQQLNLWSEFSLSSLPRSWPFYGLLLCALRFGNVLASNSLVDLFSDRIGISFASSNLRVIQKFKSKCLQLKMVVFKFLLSLSFHFPSSPFFPFFANFFSFFLFLR